MSRTAPARSWPFDIHPIDAAVAVGLAALSFLPYVSGAADLGPTGLITVGLLLLQSLPLIVRRRAPLAVLLIVVSATVVQIALLPAGEELLAGLGLLVAVYTVGERLDRSIKDARTASRTLGAPVLSVIAPTPRSESSAIQRTPPNPAFKTLAATSIATDRLPRAIMVTSPVGTAPPFPMHHHSSFCSSSWNAEGGF